MLPPGESQPPSPPERAVDLLGDLPTDVLDKLLAGLPARDVVRTSVLSPPWRHRWESVPGLDIELHDVRDDESGACWRSAARFLERCAGPVGRISIRGFSLSAYYRAAAADDDWVRADDLVRAVAGKSPRSLFLALPLTTPVPSLFHCDCTALGELELHRCAIPAPPAGFAGFQRLTKLDLDDVVFTGGNGCAQLEAMVSAAAATLVELRLQNISIFPAIHDGAVVPGAGGWVIQAPRLRRLVLCLMFDGAGLWELGALPNLEVATIFLNSCAENRDYVQMFTAITSVRELHIGNFDMATQAVAIHIFQDLLWRFVNLKILRLDANFCLPPHHLFSLSRFLQTAKIKRWYRSASPQSSRIHILIGYV